MNKRAVLIKFLGILFLAVGLFSLFFTPVEFTSFYPFSTGGGYHYEGFGFGSLMFAFIVFNVMAYFSIALLGIPIGVGTLRLKKWGLDLSIAFFRSIMIVGSASTISILLSSELRTILEPYRYLILLAFSLVFLIIMPYTLVRFYKNPETEALFKPETGGCFESQSTNSLALMLLNGFWISIFTLSIFLKGAFPLFGSFAFGREGTYLLSAAIFVLLVLSFLMFEKNKFAKYALIVCYAFLLSTFALTFSIHPTSEFLGMLNLPQYEVENALAAFRIPAGINLGIFYGVLLIIQIFMALRINDEE